MHFYNRRFYFRIHYQKNLFNSRSQSSIQRQNRRININNRLRRAARPCGFTFFLSRRPGRKSPSLRLELPPGAEPCGGRYLPFRPGRKLAPEKNHVSAPSGSSLFRNFAFPPEAEGRAGKISYFRPWRKAVFNRGF